MNNQLGVPVRSSDRAPAPNPLSPATRRIAPLFSAPDGTAIGVPVRRFLLWCLGLGLSEVRTMRNLRAVPVSDTPALRIEVGTARLRRDGTRTGTIRHGRFHDRPTTGAVARGSGLPMKTAGALSAKSKTDLTALAKSRGV